MTHVLIHLGENLILASLTGWLYYTGHDLAGSACLFATILNSCFVTYRTRTEVRGAAK